MASATVTTGTAQAQHFGRMAADWWDPRGSSAMLHRLNPVRLRYIREAVDAHWGGDPAARRPLAGKRVLDMGCGAGLLAEPLARLGGTVTGVDAAAESIAVAREHAAGVGLAIDYRAGGLDAVANETFDLVTCLEVVEHVETPATFVAGLATALDDGGLLVLSTPNRTWLSRLALIGIGETVGGIPRGTHDWNALLTPTELTALVEAAGLRVTDTRGLSFNPARGFALSADLSLDYLMTCTRA